MASLKISSKLVRAICSFVSKDKTRPDINSVHIVGHSIQATDACTAISAVIPNSEEMEVQNVSAESLTRAAIKVSSVEISKGQILSLDKDGTPSYGVDAKNTDPTKWPASFNKLVSITDGSFISINPEYLKRVADAAMAVGATSISLKRSGNETDPVEVKAIGSDGTELTMIVMPRRA